MIKIQILLFSLLGLFLSVPSVTAYWRMSCMGIVGRGQVDPIVSPGKLSAHLHTIKGGSAIALNSSVEDLLASSCTSCEIAQDKSAYWTPQLYFFDSDKNEFELVSEVRGHVTYYKFVPHFTAEGIYKMPIAIPNGMKMLSGDPFRRNFTLPVPDPPLPWSGNDATQDALQQKAIGFNCLNYAGNPEGTLQRHFLPDKNFLETRCPDGIRYEVLFPTCWDGKNLESQDLRSHLAYGSAGPNGGSCPKGYDVPIMQLLFETIYPTTGYKGRNGYFTTSQGDPTGFGYHGDAFIAWDAGVQQAAVDACGNPDPSAGAQAQDGVPAHCNVFNLNPASVMDSCTMEASAVNIQVKAKMQATALPGNNPVQFGPQRATVPGPDAPVATPPAAIPTSVIPPTQSVAARTTDRTNPYNNQFLQVAPTTTLSTSTTVVTSPPVLAANNQAGERIINTSTYTSDGAVYEIVNVEVVQTTTVYPEQPKQRKRAEHIHRHVHHRY